MNHLNIRAATMADLPTLLQFEQGVIEAERPYDPTLRDGHVRYYDIEELILSPQAEIVVAELGSEVVGTGYARIRDAKPFLRHGHEAYLGFMYVRPEHRGKGINGKIIEALKRWAPSQRLTEMRLEVYSDNAVAIAAYEKVGFVEHMVEMRMAV